MCDIQAHFTQYRILLDDNPLNKLQAHDENFLKSKEMNANQETESRINQNGGTFCK